MKSDLNMTTNSGGISACVFASKYLKNNITKSCFNWNCRGLGGRSSTD